MKSIFLKSLIITPLLVFCQSFLIPESDEFFSIVPKETEVIFVTTGHKFNEGPVWDVDNKCLYYSDIPANTIFKITEMGEKSTFLIPSGNSNGLTFDRNKHLVVCDQFNKRVARLKHGKLHTIVSKYEDKSFNSPNDVVMRKDGSLYFTDPPYGHYQFFKDTPRQISFTGVYFFNHHKCTLIDSTLIRANGICLSPDETKLYVAQSEFNWLWKVYHLDANGNVISSKIFYQSDKITGNPDGIKVDINGYIYATGNNGIVIFNPNGTLLGTIVVPENPSNLAWGGTNLDYLYVTTPRSVYKIKLQTKGFLHY